MWTHVPRVKDDLILDMCVSVEVERCMLMLQEQEAVDMSLRLCVGSGVPCYYRRHLPAAHTQTYTHTHTHTYTHTHTHTHTRTHTYTQRHVITDGIYCVCVRVCVCVCVCVCVRVCVCV